MENFPNLVKEIDIESGKHRESHTRGPQTIKHIIIKMQKVKDKERILEAAKEKQLVTYKGAPMRLSAISQQKLCRPEGIGNKYSK